MRFLELSNFGCLPGKAGGSPFCTRPSNPAALISGDTEAGAQGGVVKKIDGKTCYWVGSGYSCDEVN